MRWEGTIGRLPYALIGLFAFLLKYSLDSLIARFAFGREWPLTGYWIFPFSSVSQEITLQENAGLIAALLVLALPFIWLGVVLTIRRLRSIGWPTWLVLLFFLPFLNLIFFLLLCLLPAASAQESARLRWKLFDAVLLNTPLGAAVVAIIVTSLSTVPMNWLAIYVLEDYGWGVFVGIPFVLGFVSVMIYGSRTPKSFAKSFLVSSISLLLTGSFLLLLGLEGLICMLMALPLAAPLVWMGAALGFLLQKRSPRLASATQVIPALLLAMPTAFWMEKQQMPVPPLYSVTTAVEIDAPPETVWQSVISFEEIPEPEDWMFRLGVAYPIRAEIQGSGLGAVRYCVFSTGTFVEPIEIWDEPRLLKFSVIANPPPLDEWTPYAKIRPPHLDGFFVSESGQFLLQPLGNGGTRLVGTTWYRHDIWPTFYWRWWSDELIHRIHLRVLRHIKRQAERDWAGRVAPLEVGTIGTNTLDGADQTQPLWVAALSR